MRGMKMLPMAAGLVLGACGSGGGGGIGSAGSTPSPTSGTPTPSPAPAPTPTPTPTPTPGNTTIGDLRNNQTFTNTAAATQIAFDLNTKTTLAGSKAAGTLTVSYDAASKTYSLSTGAQSQQFTSSEIATSANGETRYQKSDGVTRDYLTLVTTPYSSTTAALPEKSG